jgi:hypothetical protein
MTTLARSSTVPLIPTNDSRPVVQAVIDGLVSGCDPETFLWIEWRLADGRVRRRLEWTAGGQALGDEVDDLALSLKLDSADWFTVLRRNRSVHERGGIRAEAHPLRGVLADVLAGVRAPEVERVKLQDSLALTRDLVLHPSSSDPRLPRWAGVGPSLICNVHR